MPLAGKSVEFSAPQRKSPPPPTRPENRAQAKASIQSITPASPNNSPESDKSARVVRIKQQYRLSKGEAAVLTCLLEKANVGGNLDCYAKIPQLAEACEMTHRGCQFALRSLESRGFVLRLKDYDPADRLGIQFRLDLPPA